ncbi:nucleotidyltransferase domain-containing protein [uncultured Clostridium sp.]|uniref:nucleotidyltransferase domain-containing protein n=1 Tax=uncultured Clostridium sp. TaxID=59620 RepID=UPI0025D2BB18|nr:nucleotidyltransferase domain-containing protein [uncultured Clostridium sp.]MDU4884608.1 nucleotidyltransferase domain-containing protein [Clostridium celatum]MDU7077764.1 nucleotidyltransferase domain-containing protein [Clostridium celatum]
MLLKDLKIFNKNIISMAIIGSYNTEYWRVNRSDIDILILLDKKIDVSIEFDLEDELIPMLQKYFNYNNIHLTFLYMKDFEHSLALEYIKSNDKLVFDKEREVDFRLYVNKYRRNNQWLEDLIKRDIKERSSINDSIL